MRVGFVGIGAMGKGMVRNLLRAGHEVQVYDVCPAAAEAVVADGARAVSSPAQAAAGAVVVFTSLPTPESLATAALGPDGILEGAVPGTYLCDMSTVDPDTTRRIHQEAARRGVRTLDCPVSGGPHGAAAGTLTIMVGGDREDYEAVLPLLQVLGRKIVYCGGIGMGQTAKICNNMVAAAHVCTTLEGILAAVRAGLDLRTFVEILRTSSGGSWMLENFIVHTVLRQAYSPARFSLSLMHKDLGLYMKTVQSLGMPSLFGSLTYQLYTAAVRSEDGAADNTVVARVLERLAGTEIGSLSQGE